MIVFFSTESPDHVLVRAGGFASGIEKDAAIFDLSLGKTVEGMGEKRTHNQRI